MTSPLLAVGIFGAPHGVRGEMRVKSYTNDPKALSAYGDLTDSTGARSFKIVALRILKDDMVVVRLDGVADRGAAALLNGVELFAHRENLPAPDADEFYHVDLVGLVATTRDGETLGRVIGLRNFGAGDILEIAPPGGGETLLFPFTKAVAPEIDVPAGSIVIVPPREIDGETPEDEG
jgi:16S rRNA processing protein RimM